MHFHGFPPGKLNELKRHASACCQADHFFDFGFFFFFLVLALTVEELFFFFPLPKAWFQFEAYLGVAPTRKIVTSGLLLG